jgi:hypothetical protein
MSCLSRYNELPPPLSDEVVDVETQVGKSPYFKQYVVFKSQPCAPPSQACHVGWSVGAVVGINVGMKVGANVGISVGTLVGMWVGSREGVLEGVALGVKVGISVGAAVGMPEGLAVPTQLVSLVGSETNPSLHKHLYGVNLVEA